MNSVQLIGRLTRDPEADRTAGGTAVTTFRLAIERPGRDAADFVTVKTWERLAETTAEHLSRGRRVAVQGRLAHEEWLASDGRRAERLTVVADRVDFLDPPTASTDVHAGEPEVAAPHTPRTPAPHPRADEPPRSRLTQPTRTSIPNFFHNRDNFFPQMTSHFA